MKADARVFLGGRRSATPEAFARHSRTAITDWQRLQVKTALGMQFRHTSRVVIVKPAWMPAWLYRRLLRSIVIETKDMAAR